MNRADRINEYGVKEVPNLFICDKEGNVLYYSRWLKKAEFSPIFDQRLWECNIVGAIGNLEDWYNIPYDEAVDTFYFRTFKRNRNTGEDEPLCFAITPEKIIPQGFNFAADGEPFNFPIVIRFRPHKLIWISDNDCPNYEVCFKENENENSVSHIILSKPKRTFKEVQVNNCKKRLDALRGKINEDKKFN